VIYSKKKIDEGVSLKIGFPDYDGPHEYQAYIDFITQKYASQSFNKEKKLYPYITIATSQENVEAVWNVCNDIILQKALSASGL